MPSEFGRASRSACGLHITRCLIAFAQFLVAAVLAGCYPATPWSPDGTKIAMAVSGDILVYDTVSSRFSIRLRGKTGEHELQAPAWSPDSRKLAFFDVKGNGRSVVASLVSEDLTTQQRTVVVASIPTHRSKPHENYSVEFAAAYNGPVWSPNGKEIAYVGDDDQQPALWVVSAEGGKPMPLTSVGRQVLMPNWSPDGQHLAYMSSTRTEDSASELELVERDGSGRRTLFRAHDGLQLASGAEWSPDGSNVGLFLSHAGKDPGDPAMLEAWNLTLAGGALRKVADLPNAAKAPSFSPDLKSIPFEMETGPAGPKQLTRVAVLEPPYATPRFLANPFPYRNASITIPMASPDGKMVSFLTSHDQGCTLLSFRYLDNVPGVDIVIPK